MAVEFNKIINKKKKIFMKKNLYYYYMRVGM